MIESFTKGVVLLFPKDPQEHPPVLKCSYIKQELRGSSASNLETIDRLIVIHSAPLSAKKKAIKEVCDLTKQQASQLIAQVCSRLLSSYKLIQKQIKEAHHDSYEFYQAIFGDKVDLSISIAMNENLQSAHQNLDFLYKECQTLGSVVDVDAPAYQE